MIIKVDYDRLNDTSIDIKKESDNLNSEVDKLLQVLERIKDNWSGVDHEIFNNKAYAYFNNIRQIAGSLDEFSSFMNYADKSYEARDLRWKEEIMEAGGNFGDEELRHGNK